MKNQKRKPTHPAGQPDLRLIIVAEIFNLLKEGKINHLITWKPIEKQPNLIEVVCTPEENGESILVHCKHMDTVGHGYLPEGYPEKYKSAGKSTRFHVLLLVGDDEPETESEVTDTESPK